jgi:hypothetical protein
MSLVLHYFRNLTFFPSLTLVAAASQFAAAQQGTSQMERRLLGTVVTVDRPARMLVVQEFETEKLLNVFVPADRNIHLSERMRFANLPENVGVDNVMRGMIVDLIVSPRANYGTTTARN